MAKKNLGKLAGLAALAGAAYMASKGKDKDDAGDQKTSSYSSADTRTKDTDAATNESSYMPRSTRTAQEGVGSATNDPLASPKPAPSQPKSVAKSPVSAADEDTTTAPTKPLDTPAQRTDQLANLSRAVNREDKTKKYAQNEFRDVGRTYTRNGKPALEATKLYDDLDKKAGAATKSAFKTDALKVASRAAAAADARRRAAAASEYKKGGKVKKMASGGMTASKRADGIASRGKTKCKMY
jgi:hypothetical protein